MCCKGKRGVSTVLGTLIFMGILFTSVIPMYLFMKQADTIYIQKIDEMECLDEERAREEIDVCAYPLGETSDQLKVRVENKGAVSVTVVRVWINDVYHAQDEMIPSMEKTVLGPFTVSLQPDSYYAVKVTTEKGNIYASKSGTLYYTDGTWYTPSLGISVNIANVVGKYHIQVANAPEPNEYWTQGTDFGDVIHWFAVDISDIYTVTIEKWVGGSNWVDLPGTPVNVVIQWPDGPPIVYVYASGIGV